MILTKLPSHLEKYSSHGTPVPMKGSRFRPADENWFDPVSQTMFWSNGLGYLESSAWGLAEHPDLLNILEQWNLPVEQEAPVCMGGTAYGFEELRKLYDDILAMAPVKDETNPNINPPFWWQCELKDQLKKLGVEFDYEEIKIDKDDLGTDFVTNVKGYSEAVDSAVRTYFGFKQYALQNLTPELPPSKKAQKKGLIQMTKENDNQSLWAKLSSKWMASGLEEPKMHELLERVCHDLGQKEFKLTDVTRDVFASAVEQELLLVRAQNGEPTEPEVEEKSGLVVEGEEPTTDSDEEQRHQRLLDIHKLATDNGISSQQVKDMHQNLTFHGEGMDDETLRNLELAIQDWVNVGHGERLKEEASEPEVVNPDPIQEAEPEVIQEQPEESKSKGRGKRIAKPKEDKPAKVPPKEEIYEKHVVNHKTGEAKTFKTVMEDIRRLFDWNEYYKKETKQNNGRVKGKLYLFWSSMHDIVHEQFMKQFNRDTKEFKPATVTTPWGKFGRKALQSGGPTCTNRAKFVEFLKQLTPEEASAYCGAIRTQCVATDDDIAAIVEQGIEVPGWEIVEPSDDVDPVGTIYLIGASKLMNDLAEFDEDKEEEAEPEEEEEEAA